MEMLEFAFKLVIGFSALSIVSADVACYRCRNGKDCMEPTVSRTTQVFCIGDDVCGTRTLFTRANTSEPYSEQAVSIERMCMFRHSYSCTMESPCVKKDTTLTCYSCCDSARCNEDLPGYSVAVLQSKSSVVLVFFSALLAWCVLTMTSFF